MTSQVTVSFVNSQEQASFGPIIERFQRNLDKAVAAGDLQRQLRAIHPDTPITILTGLVPPPTVPAASDDDNSLRGGGVAGIAIAAALVVVVAALLVRRRPRRGDTQKKKDKEVQYRPHHADESDSRGDDDDNTKNKIPSELQSVSSVFTDTAPKGKKGTRISLEAMETGDDLVAEPELEHYETGSSNAGSSGWSSSAGISSLNTGHSDEHNLIRLPLSPPTTSTTEATTTLAALGAGSALAARTALKSRTAMRYV
jgi:hypothetical protein